jgi:hypothetical protein
MRAILTRSSDPTPRRPAAAAASSRGNAPGLQRSAACACGGGCPRCRAPLPKTAVLRASPLPQDPEAAVAAPGAVREALARDGEPLSRTTRADMEERFGADFGTVRVHTGEAAGRSAEAVAARAYTVGNHIVFGEGQYAPGSATGRRLIAHELAHVLQQGARGAALPQLDTLRIGARDDPLEREADTLADAALAGAPTPVLSGGAASRVQRQELPDAGTPDAGPSGGEASGGGADAGTEPADAGAGGDAAPPAEAPAAPCDPRPLPRDQYLQHPGTSTGDLGLTVLSGTVGTPAVVTRRTRRGLVLEQTDAVLPPLDSVYTQAGTFTEGQGHFIDSGGADCPSGRYDLRWTITPEGAAKIRAGEVEHCADLRHAFDISLRRYADAVNAIAASGRVFASERAATRAVTRQTGAAPDDWFAVFECLARKTTDRDFMQWHTPRTRQTAPSYRNGCAYASVFVHGSSFPHVGQHPTADLIRDCGESGGDVPAPRRRRAMPVAKPVAGAAIAPAPAPAGLRLQRQADDDAPPPATEGCGRGHAEMLAGHLEHAREWIDRAAPRARAYADGSAAGAARDAVESALADNFNATGPAEAAAVAAGLERIRSALNGPTRYECAPARSCARGDLAYVLPISDEFVGLYGDTVYLCPRWFSCPDYYTRVTTLIHESAHQHVPAHHDVYEWQAAYHRIAPHVALANAESYAVAARQIYHVGGHGPGTTTCRLRHHD